MAEKKNTADAQAEKPKQKRTIRSYDERIAELQAKANEQKLKRAETASKKYAKLVEDHAKAADKAAKLGQEILDLAAEFEFELPPRLSEAVALDAEVAEASAEVV